MTHHHRTNRRPGFTLIELLVVMGIIILIAASAIPAFRFITGSRSTDGAANVVNAMISRARSQALVDEQTYGVFFFLDPINDRSSMALVRQGGDGADYRAWTPNVTYYDNTTLNPASNALQLVQTQEVVDGTNLRKFAPILFSCIAQHQSAQGNAVSNVPAYGNPTWALGNYGLEIVDNTDLQVLPQGVGCQVMIDQRNVASDGQAIDRYVRTGAILFDGQGRFSNTPYDVSASSKLGKALFLDQIASAGGTGQTTLASGPGAKSPISLYSGFGVVLYDRSSFIANGYTEGDYLYGAGTSHFPAPPYSAYGANDLTKITNAATEQAEEKWLDGNSLLLSATRYNGAMTRGE